MKRNVKRLSCIIISILLVALACIIPNVSANEIKSGVKYINVKDFGAVGDGITDDKSAIVSALNYAALNLPATVYFPEGEYGLLKGGIYLKLPLGAGGLTVKGEGGGKSVIKYLNNWSTDGTWVALRIQPKSTPKTTEDYIHDITITDLGVYDTDPVNHAWTVESNGAKEETHGFDIQHCVRARIDNCFINNVGDEAIDMVYCEDSIITNNNVSNSPGAGSAGGAISVGDGCKNVCVSGNVVNGSIQNADKSNFGIAVEALIDPVSAVVIANNNISNIAGYGVNIGAPRGSVDNITLQSNNIVDCSNGIRLMGTGRKSNVNMTGNNIENVKIGLISEGGNSSNIVFDSFVINEIQSCGIRVVTPSAKNTIISNGVISNSQSTAIYNAGIGTKISDVLINGVGLKGGVKTAAVSQYVDAGDCEMSKVTILNCKNQKAVQGVDTVIDTKIEQEEKSGYVSISGAKTIKGGSVNRLIQGIRSGSMIDGLQIKTQANLGTHAVLLSGVTECKITNCIIDIPTKYYAIRETGTADYNLITNNIIKGRISIIGKKTVDNSNIIK